jgi:hypothetical protein
MSQEIENTPSNIESFAYESLGIYVLKSLVIAVSLDKFRVLKTLRYF